MSNSLMQYLKKFTCSGTDTSLKNTNGTQVDSQAIPDPIMPQKEEALALLTHQEELIKNVCTCIKDCYPDMKRLNIKVYPSYLSDGKLDDNNHTMVITWQDSANECIVHTLVKCVIDEYCEAVGMSPGSIQLQFKRNYSDRVILHHSKNYANCIAPNIPLNMHNIHCFKIGGVPIYELVIGELNLMDEVKS